MYHVGAWSLVAILSFLLFGVFFYEIFNQFAQVTAYNWWYVFKCVWVFDVLCFTVIVFQSIYLLRYATDADGAVPMPGSIVVPDTDEFLPVPTWPMVCHEARLFTAFLLFELFLVVNLTNLPHAPPIPWIVVCAPAIIYFLYVVVCDTHPMRNATTLPRAFLFTCANAFAAFFLLLGLCLDRAPAFPPALVLTPLFVINGVALVSLWIVFKRDRHMHIVLLCAILATIGALFVALGVATSALVSHAAYTQWQWVTITVILFTTCFAWTVLLVIGVFTKRQIQAEFNRYVGAIATEVVDAPPPPSSQQQQQTIPDLLVASAVSVAG